MQEAHDLQDLARSSYADMLNDDERNRAYDLAIQNAVKSLVLTKERNPSKDKYFNCCDIGVGSGLLSMMVVRAFKSLNYNQFHVTAFEAYEPMAKCAQLVIDSNGMTEYVTIHPKRSDQVDVKERFDLLVAELLDTELIGEGCLGVYRHAVENLCKQDCLCVPHEARILIEPIASSLLFQRHAIADLKLKLDGGRFVHIQVPDDVKDCCGMPEIDDMQVSALRKGEDFERFCQPKEVFKFTFGSLKFLNLREDKMIEFDVTKKLEHCPVIAMWWDILMFDANLTEELATNGVEADTSLHVLSCAPIWARDGKMLERDSNLKRIYSREVWREHWIQGIYYMSDVVCARQLTGSLDKGSKLSIYAYHDSHSLWFDLKPCDSSLPRTCKCGVHRRMSRSELAVLSCNETMSKLLSSSIDDSHCNLVADIVFDRHLVKPDAPKWHIEILGNGHLKKLPDLLLGDDIPWSGLMSRHQSGLPIDPIENFSIKYTQVQFTNLNRIRARIELCEGFDLHHLDEMILRSSELVDSPTESHYLWEYSGKRLDTDHTLYCTTWSHKDDGDLSQNLISDKFWTDFQPPDKTVVSGTEWLNGWALVFWAELTLKKTGEIISTGPVGSCKTGEEIVWNRYFRQPVLFMHLSKQAAELRSRL